MEIKSIAELCEIINGGTPKTSIPEYWNGNIGWLSVKDFGGGKKYVYESEKCITELGVEKSSTHILKKNDIILSARGTVGEMAMIGIPMAFNQSCFGLRTKDTSKLDQEYLYYSLKNSIHTIESVTQGSVFQTINRASFERIYFSYFDIEIQKKIAAILSKIDKKIEVNDQINRNLEEQVQSLFSSMFPNCYQGDNYVKNYISPRRGKNLLSKNAVPGEVPVVAGGLQPATYHNVANTVAPVLTISASGANAGYVQLWEENVWSSDSSYIDKSMTENVYFWYVMLKSRQDEIYDAQTGSAQPHIYPKHIDELPIMNLNENDIKQFNDLVLPFFEMIGENKKENKRLSQLRDTLLPKLMSGELDVSGIDI